MMYQQQFGKQPLLNPNSLVTKFLAATLATTAKTSTELATKTLITSKSVAKRLKLGTVIPDESSLSPD
jgi:hypothetical protein